MQLLITCILLRHDTPLEQIFAVQFLPKKDLNLSVFQCLIRYIAIIGQQHPSMSGPSIPTLRVRSPLCLPSYGLNVPTGADPIGRPTLASVKTNYVVDRLSRS